MPWTKHYLHGAPKTGLHTRIWRRVMQRMKFEEKNGGGKRSTIEREIVVGPSSLKRDSLKINFGS